jgi:predicted MFS family arabinose efflux permease
MPARRLKPWFFAIEGLNAFAVIYFLNYLFFLLRDEYGFGNRENLAVCAVHGLCYMLASWQAGRFAQRLGYFAALKTGLVLMLVSLGLGMVLGSVAAIVVLLAVWTTGMCFLWPSLEALVTEGESDRGVARMVGVYSLTWSAAAALANFTGGVMFDHLGRHSIYWIPASIHVGQLLMVFWLQKRPEAATLIHAHKPVPVAGHVPEAAALLQPIKPRAFLWMGWYSNPFAYVAVSTIAAVIPRLADRFGLSATQSGFLFSLWMFVRIGAFASCWHWTGWHYRFRWLLAAFAGLVVGFMGMVLAPQLWMALTAQLFFGAAIGLIYYSSLFYSMDVGDTRGEHGGLHEAALGVGIFVGPAIGAVALQIAPGLPNAGMWTVSGLLAAGFAGLGLLRWGGGKPRKLNLEP